MQTTCARANQVLAGAPLDNGDVDSRQCQFACQHQPRRASPDNHHRMVGYRFDHSRCNPPIQLSSGFGQQFCGMTRVLPQAPGCAIN